MRKITGNFWKLVSWGGSIVLILNEHKQGALHQEGTLENASALTRTDGMRLRSDCQLSITMMPFLTRVHLHG